MIKAQSRTTLCQSLELPCHPTHIEAQGVEWSGEMEGENSLRAESAIHMFISKLVKTWSWWDLSFKVAEQQISHKSEAIISYVIMLMMVCISLY